MGPSKVIKVYSVQSSFLAQLRSLLKWPFRFILSPQRETHGDPIARQD